MSHYQRAGCRMNAALQGLFRSNRPTPSHLPTSGKARRHSLLTNTVLTHLTSACNGPDTNLTFASGSTLAEWDARLLQRITLMIGKHLLKRLTISTRSSRFLPVCRFKRRSCQGTAPTQPFGRCHLLGVTAGPAFWRWRAQTVHHSSPNNSFQLPITSTVYLRLERRSPSGKPETDFLG